MSANAARFAGLIPVADGREFGDLDPNPAGRFARRLRVLEAATRRVSARASRVLGMAFAGFVFAEPSTTGRGSAVNVWFVNGFSCDRFRVSESEQPGERLPTPMRDSNKSGEILPLDFKLCGMVNSYGMAGRFGLEEA